MTIETRKTIRERLATELETAYGSTVYDVYPFMATAFEGRSPVVRIMNAGSMRPRRAGVSAHAIKSDFRYVIQHFVRFDDSEDLTDQQAAEDTLDSMELILANFMSSQDQVPGIWKSIEQADYSEPALVKIGSFQYLLEAFLIEVQAYA